MPDKLEIIENDVSVIIPCFNRVNILKETLKSVENAIKYLKVEIILVDDGSEISIESQLADFGHLSIRFIRQNNSGLIKAKYNGLMASTGTYVLFLDSDDQISEDKLTVQVNEMQRLNADVSYSDTQIWRHQSPDNSLTLVTTHVINSVASPPEFYLRVQPAPHSPVYLRSYLIKYLADPFIKLSRQFDSIGEVWLYYNLCVFDAKIIKIDKPLTMIIEHGDERLTNYWERLGLAALAIQIQFEMFAPKLSLYYNDARKQAALTAFETFRRLPYNVNRTFQTAYLNLWEKLGGSTITELKGGRGFNLLAKIFGCANAAKFIRRFKTNDYDKIKTITKDEFEKTLAGILTPSG